MTDAPALDEREHSAALKAILNPALGIDPATGEHRAYDLGTVPGFDGNTGKQPNAFLVIAMESRPGALLKAGRGTNSNWRYILVHVGRSVDEARKIAFITRSTLAGVRLVVDGVESTPLSDPSASHGEGTRAITKHDSGVYINRYAGAAFYNATY